MSRNTHNLLIVLSLLLLSTTNLAQADYNYPPEAYSTTLTRKLGSGFANMISAPLEVPKSIITEVNQTNIFWGFAGGITLGIIDTMGRIATGVSDFLLAPIPTQPSISPLYIWDDFDQPTKFGPIFRLTQQK